MSSKKQAFLQINGQTIELPLLSGNMGPDVIDVRQLSAHGLLTYDPGFMSTASCASAITYIDGANGVLLHRGYPIKELAQRSNFLELSYLLFHGELPTPAQYTEFMSKVQGDQSDVVPRLAWSGLFDSRLTIFVLDRPPPPAFGTGPEA